MKSKQNSKKNFKHSDIEKSDISSHKGRVTKKDSSSKRRLSIYDDFDDDSYIEDPDLDYPDNFDD